LSLFSDSLNGLDGLQHPPIKVLFVVAAGNGRNRVKKGTETGEPEWVGVNLDVECSTEPFYPACLDSNETTMITVAALKDARSLMQSSNFGEKRVQIAAPGLHILSASSGVAPDAEARIPCDFDSLDSNDVDEPATGRPCFAVFSGTSQATAFVTFTAAVLMAKNSSLQPEDVRTRILSTCDHVPQLRKLVTDGCRLNFLKAIAIDEDLIELPDGVIRADAIEPLTIIGNGSGEQHLDRSKLIRVEGNGTNRTIWTKDNPEGFQVQVKTNQMLRYRPSSSDDCDGAEVERIDSTSCQVPLSAVTDLVVGFQAPQ
jgi:hypothetical protein